MIRLIVSDIDGTLTEDGGSRLDPELYEVILKLKSQGIYFAAASGRHSASIEYIFDPIKDKIFYIGDNGAYLGCHGRSLFVNPIEPELVREVIEAVRRHAEAGKLLLGICNGFQVLTETKLLPGALLANTSTTFLCKKCWMRVERTDNRFTSGFKKGDIVQYPIAHHEGLYFLPDKELRELEESGRVVFRYADPQTGEAGAEYAPNGALNGIAGICNKEGNILGLMPHPERATIAHLNGGSDGGDFWRSIAQDFAKRGAL